MELIFMVRSSFNISKVTATKVFIIDNDIGCSVTNDAENVVENVNTQYPNRRIIYRDTDGRWDELVHVNGIFGHFKVYEEELP